MDKQLAASRKISSWVVVQLQQTRKKLSMKIMLNRESRILLILEAISTNSSARERTSQCNSEKTRGKRNSLNNVIIGRRCLNRRELTLGKLLLLLNKCKPLLTKHQSYLRPCSSLK
jgi:hypothetical protein